MDRWLSVPLRKSKKYSCKKPRTNDRGTLRREMQSLSQQQVEVNPLCSMCQYLIVFHSCWSVGPVVRKKSSLQSQEEWGQARTCQHLRIGISLHLIQREATISFTPSKSHAKFALNLEPFLLATCHRIKPPQEAKWGGFLACTIALQIELSVKCLFASS